MKDRVLSGALSRVQREWLGSVIAVAMLALAPSTALASFPGANGRIAYTYFPDSPPPPPPPPLPTIHTILPSGHSDRQLTPSTQYSADPSWSPDGTRIAFNRYPNHRGDIFTMSATGDEVRRLTHSDLSETTPTYSPSGNRLVFARANLSTARQAIVSMRTDGTDRRVLARTRTNGLHDPVYAPNGRHIAYMVCCHGPGAGLSVMRPDGSHKRLLASTRHPASWPPDYSSDSRHIVFERCEAGYNDCLPITIVVRSDGTHRHRAPCNMAGTAYSPDNTRFIGAGDNFASFALYTFPTTAASSAGCRSRQITFPTGQNATLQPDWQPLPGR